MKKLLIPVGAVSLSVLLLASCHHHKPQTEPTTNASATTPAVSYAVNMKSIVADHCSPCHIPAKGGNKKPLDNYDALKGNIDSILHRIQLNPGDKGFMPAMHPKLSDSIITVFKQWHDAGMPQ